MEREAQKSMLCFCPCWITSLFSDCGILKSTPEVSLNLGYYFRYSLWLKRELEKKSVFKKSTSSEGFSSVEVSSHRVLYVSLQPIISIHSAAPLWNCQISNIIYKSVPDWLQNHSWFWSNFCKKEVSISSDPNVFWGYIFTAAQRIALFVRKGVCDYKTQCSQNCESSL